MSDHVLDSYLVRTPPEFWLAPLSADDPPLAGDRGTVWAKRSSLVAAAIAAAWFPFSFSFAEHVICVASWGGCSSANHFPGMPKSSSNYSVIKLAKDYCRLLMQAIM